MQRSMEAARATMLLAALLGSACGNDDEGGRTGSTATGAGAASTGADATTGASAAAGSAGEGGASTGVGVGGAGSAGATTGAGGAGTTGTTGGGGGEGVAGGPPSCDGDASGLFPPTGFDNVSNTLASRWSPEPIGSTLRPFTMFAGVDSSFSFVATDLGFGDDPERVYFTVHSENSAPQAPWAQADYRWVTVSECPRDLRPGVPGHPDPTLDPGCRAYANEGQVLVLNFGPPITGACNLDPDRAYWLNVVLEDPSDGLDPTEPERCTKMICGFRMAVL
jgi:hypothetical protein